jgi:hypothetical protein
MAEQGPQGPQGPQGLQGIQGIGRIEETLLRVQGEFREMPGLRLTRAQAGRLWGLDAASSQALLDALVDARFLTRTPEGAFMRHADPVPGPPSERRT